MLDGVGLGVKTRFVEVRKHCGLCRMSHDIDICTNTGHNVNIATIGRRHIQQNRRV